MGTKRFEVLISWTLYPLGDLIGQLITHQFCLNRLLVLALAGGLVYQTEIPLWFQRLNEKSLNSLARTLGSICYFNPFWIARHMVFIKLATEPWLELVPHVTLATTLTLALKSFLFNLPLSLVGNYVIHDKLPLRMRYAGSIVLSTVLSVFYALLYSGLK